MPCKEKTAKEAFQVFQMNKLGGGGALSFLFLNKKQVARGVEFVGVK